MQFECFTHFGKGFSASRLYVFEIDDDVLFEKIDEISCWENGQEEEENNFFLNAVENSIYSAQENSSKGFYNIPIFLKEMKGYGFKAITNSPAFYIDIRA